MRMHPRWSFFCGCLFVFCWIPPDWISSYIIRRFYYYSHLLIIDMLYILTWYEINLCCACSAGMTLKIDCSWQKVGSRRSWTCSSYHLTTSISKMLQVIASNTRHSSKLASLVPSRCWSGLYLWILGSSACLRRRWRGRLCYRFGRTCVVFLWRFRWEVWVWMFLRW